VAARSLIPRLTDIIEAIERVNAVLADVALEAFEYDWQRQWLVERGVEIISEASRHLPDDLKARNPQRTASRLREYRRAGSVEAGASRPADIGKSLPLGISREKRLLGSALSSTTGADGVAKLWLVSRFAYSFSSRICAPL
jgi:hypothetical protein